MSPKDRRDHLWQYFQFHADQRMKMFNYYLLWTALVFSGLTGLIKDLAHPLLSYVLCATHIFLSILFYKIDRRHRVMIDIVEDDLRMFEANVMGKDERIFTQEEEYTVSVKKISPPRGIMRGHFTCGVAFKCIFFGMASVSFMFAMFFLAVMLNRAFNIFTYFIDLWKNA